MRRPLGLTLTLVLGLLFAGCGGDDDDGSADPVDAAVDAAPPDADPTPAESCVRPGDKGNEIGVGEYCTPGGSECSSFDLAPLCLATVGQDQWFCTRIGCDAQTNCGQGAGCLITGGGSACVPCRCEPTGVGCP